MKNIIRIYKIALKSWHYIALSLLTMFIFSLLSGANVSIVKPLFDNVFNKTHVIEITTYQQFFDALGNQIKAFFEDKQLISLLFSTSKLKPLFAQINVTLDKTSAFLLLKLIAGFIIALFFTRNAFFVLNQYFSFKIQARLNKTLRKCIFSKYINLSLKFFNTNRTGDSMVRINHDVWSTNDFVVKGTIAILQSFVTILIFARIAIFINAKLFIQSIIIVPIIALIIGYLGTKLKKYAKRLQSQFSNVFSHIEEVFANIKIVKAFNKEEHENSVFSTINSKFIKFWKRFHIYNSLSVPLGEFNSVIIGIIVLLIGGYQVLNPAQSFTFGDFMAFLIAVFSIQHPLKIIIKKYTEYKKSAVSANRIFEILDIEEDIGEDDNPIELNEFKKSIELKNVSFKYNPDGDYVLKNINLVIKKGEKVAFTGLSGSGKTTLLNLLNRMYDPYEGEILIDGINIKKYSIKSLRNTFGIVTQKSMLFEGTIAENIAYSNISSFDENQIIKAAKTANADDFINEFEDKYNYMLKPKAVNISGGQQQRLCIARAILANPSILLFDEATSALDTESEAKVQAAIDNATKNRTVCVVAHRLSTIINSTKIVVISQGQIKATGTHKQLMETSKLWQKLFKMQYKN